MTARRALRSPEVREYFDKEGIDPIGNTPSELRAKATKITVD